MNFRYSNVYIPIMKNIVGCNQFNFTPYNNIIIIIIMLELLSVTLHVIDLRSEYYNIVVTQLNKYIF